MNRLLSATLACLLIGTLLCCNSNTLLDKPYQEKTATEDVQAILKEDTLAAVRITTAIVKHKSQGTSLAGMTYKQLEAEGKDLFDKDGNPIPYEDKKQDGN